MIEETLLGVQEIVRLMICMQVMSGADLETSIYVGGSGDSIPLLTTTLIAGFVKGKSRNHYIANIDNAHLLGSFKIIHVGVYSRSYEMLKKQAEIVIVTR
mmetsp:Transcript_8226/g.11945  ORF Transcript_8226/g.11945 Transcript_8226/m.11945 type:complete len:100 (+) Transcript_8226:1216-1515(+)